MIDVIKLAREAAHGRHATNEVDAHSLRVEELSRFAELVLEEAANVCDELAELNRRALSDSMWQQGECAAAIRAMKPTQIEPRLGED